MKPRMLRVLAVLLVLLIASSVPAAAGGPTVPFKAFYMVSPTNEGTNEQGCNIHKFPSVGDATHLGEGTWYSDAITCMDSPTTGTQSGTSIFTADNGAQLSGTFSGVAAFEFSTGEPVAHFSGTYWVTSGTGRLAGYTGTGKYWGTARPLAGAGEIYFEGTLTKPQKP